MVAAATTPPRGFPDVEYEVRLEGAQREMSEAGLDALLLTTAANIAYFSGFQTQFWQSPTRPWFLVLPKTGKPVAVIPEIGAACMARGWIDDVRTWSSPHPTDDGVSLLAAALTECAGKTGRIGVPMRSETHLRMPMADYGRLRKKKTGVEFSDATDIVRELRMVKSPLEIAKISHVCGLVSDAFEAAPDLFAAGQSDIEAFRAFKIECLRRGVDDVSYLVGGAGPGGYDDIISPPSERPLQSGDVLILDTGCVFDGYFCDFDRNFAIEHASDDARRAYDTVYQATEAGLTTAHPGATCADIFHAMQAVLDAGGALGNDVGRLGHGLGSELTEPPSHAPFDDTVLKPGMVITLEPGMEFAPGKLMVHEENIVIREDGAELLTRRAAPELPVIG
ncbi:MAG: M24 family metallopeptidase [Alphaproteobacteria bacterium]|nr:M24 family metallopeptidase [Alphaproteobacteria bacterium]